MGVSGPYPYEKRGIARDHLLTEEGFSLRDPDTSSRARVVMQVPKTPNLDIAFIFSTSAARTIRRTRAVRARSGIPRNDSR